MRVNERASAASTAIHPEADASGLLETVRGGLVPEHVAVIMDGNGRWAADRGLPRWEGHRAGMGAVREVIEGAAEARVPHLTLYAFSQENWQRPEPEVERLQRVRRAAPPASRPLSE